MKLNKQINMKSLFKALQFSSYFSIHNLNKETYNLLTSMVSISLSSILDYHHLLPAIHFENNYGNSYDFSKCFNILLKRLSFNS